MFGFFLLFLIFSIFNDIDNVVFKNCIFNILFVTGFVILYLLIDFK